MDLINEKVDLSADKLGFSGESGQKKYALDLQLYGEVDFEASKWTKTGFHLLVVLEKKDKNAAFWPRLTKLAQKNSYIQVDWSKWVDEDEEEEDPNKGLGGLDPSQMQSKLEVIQISEVMMVWEVLMKMTREISMIYRRRKTLRAKRRNDCLYHLLLLISVTPLTDYLACYFYPKHLF